MESIKASVIESIQKTAISPLKRTIKEPEISPPRRLKSRSPPRRSRSNSRRLKSRSPQQRNTSRSPLRGIKSRSPSPKKSPRLAQNSPVKFYEDLPKNNFYV